MGAIFCDKTISEVEAIPVQSYQPGKSVGNYSRDSFLRVNDEGFGHLAGIQGIQKIRF